MSINAIKAAFEKHVVVLPLDIIVPQREARKRYLNGDFYKQLESSLKQVGLIEPLVVYPRGPADCLLLDGHLRLEILKSMGAKEVKCLLSTDDESYTYNRHVNHIPPIAQHFMLLEALKTGLTEERIAAALDISLESIRTKRDMLNGICPEAVQILIDKHVSPKVFFILRKMKPVRQIEAAEHMVAGGTYIRLSGNMFSFAFRKTSAEDSRASFSRKPHRTMSPGTCRVLSERPIGLKRHRRQSRSNPASRRRRGQLSAPPERRRLTLMVGRNTLGASSGS